MLGREEKIAILTADAYTFRLQSMQRLLIDYGAAEDSFTDINRCIGEKLESKRLVVVGLRDLPGFEAIENGTKKNCELIRNGLVNRISEVLAENPDVKGILSECTMIPGYSATLRN